MINIPVSEEQKRKIEEKYWKWFKKYHVKELKSVIKKDCVMHKVIRAVMEMKEISEELTSIEKEEVQRELNEEEQNESTKRDKKDSKESQKEYPLDKVIKYYLLLDYNKLENLKQHIDKYKYEKKIKEETKQFFYARYANYRDSQAAKIVKELGVSVCPYCNQNHINIIYKGNKTKLWGDLDHFYAKSIYPELAICLYNMVPVCKVCNQLKSSKNKELINPYNCSVKRGIKFRTEFDEKVDLDYLQGKSQNFIIKIITDETKVKQNDLAEIELFDLENRYSQLKENVQEIILKSRAYDLVYQNKLKEFGLSEEEIKRYVFGYTENHLNRVLSKFNMDIMKEFIGEC